MPNARGIATEEDHARILESGHSMLTRPCHGIAPKMTRKECLLVVTQIMARSATMTTALHLMMAPVRLMKDIFLLPHLILLQRPLPNQQRTRMWFILPPWRLQITRLLHQVRLRHRHQAKIQQFPRHHPRPMIPRHHNPPSFQPLDRQTDLLEAHQRSQRLFQHQTQH